MATIWDDTGYPMATSAVPRRVVVLRGRWRAKRQNCPETNRGSDSTDQGLKTAQEPTGFHGDVSGSPSETINYDHYGAVMAERRRREAGGGE